MNRQTLTLSTKFTNLANLVIKKSQTFNISNH